MRILMLSWEYPPHIIGGLGAHVADLVPALTTEEVQVTLVTPLLRGGSPDQTSPTGEHIVRVVPPHSEGHSFTSFVYHTNQELDRAARALFEGSGRFDLIHTHDWLTAPAAIALKQHWHIPLIATIHATERGRGRGTLNGEQALQIDSLEWQLSYEAWRVIVCSHFMARQLIDTFRTPPDKIDVVPNGTRIRPNPFAHEAERLAFRRRYAADHERIIFYVGRIVYEKGLHVLLDAWPLILQHASARLIIAGSGPYLDMLKLQAQTMGISETVAFPGFISDTERDQLYHVADVTTFPSLYEPFGIVALEAYAARSPVVVACTGGLMEVVRMGETGLTVTPGSAPALAQGILSTLQETDKTRRRVANAYTEVHELYNWQHIARKTIAVYQQVYAEWQVSSWGKEGYQPPGDQHMANYQTGTTGG